MIPLLIGAGVAGLLGAVGTSVAKDEQKAVEDTINEANRVYNNAKEKLENAQKNAEQSLEKYGRLKYNVAKEISDFVEAYNRIKDKLRSANNDTDDLKNLNFNNVSRKDWNEIKDLAEAGKLISSGTATGVAAGTAIALGAGAISIDALLGAGTMAWAASTLGVGSAATLAVAGLGGVIPGLAIVAGPALLVGSFAAYYKAEQAHEKANAALAEARTAAEKMNTSTLMCNKIEEYGNFLFKITSSLEPMLKNSIDELNKISYKYSSGCKLEDFAKDDQNFLAASLAIAKAIKTIYNTPILDSNGNLTFTQRNVEDLTNECKEEINKYYLYTSKR